MNRYDVGEVRKIGAATLGDALRRSRYFLSTKSGCEELLEKLKGKQHEVLLAELTELFMLHLGHATEEPASSPNSEVRRAVKRQRA